MFAYADSLKDSGIRQQPPTRQRNWRGWM